MLPAGRQAPQELDGTPEAPTCPSARLGPELRGASVPRRRPCSLRWAAPPPRSNEDFQAEGPGRILEALVTLGEGPVVPGHGAGPARPRERAGQGVLHSAWSPAQPAVSSPPQGCCDSSGHRQKDTGGSGRSAPETSGRRGAGQPREDARGPSRQRRQDAAPSRAARPHARPPRDRGAQGLGAASGPLLGFRLLPRGRAVPVQTLPTSLLGRYGNQLGRATTDGRAAHALG